MMFVIFAESMEENWRKVATKLEVATVMCNNKDFTSKVMMMNNNFFVQFLTNNSSRTLINRLLALFITYYVSSMLLFSLRSEFGDLTEPPKELFEAFFTSKATTITSNTFIHSTKTYITRFFGFFAQHVASISILSANGKL